MLTFSGFKAARADLLRAVEEFLPALLGELGAQGDADCGAKIPATLQQTCLSALANEMKISKELTKWPCRSFKELESARLPLRFHALSANCSAPHVKCSVQFDMKEQKL